mgnify:CR=1 FL=1
MKYAMNSRLDMGGSKSIIEQKFKDLAKGLSKDQLNRILSGAIIGTPGECIKKLEEYETTKLDYIILMSNNTLRDIENFGKAVLPSFN